MAHISVVIPVYKAKDCLHELYSRLKKTLEIITLDFEIILVEDCGHDGSWEIIKALSKKDHRLKGLQFSRNFGQHYGITAGLDYCDGDWVVVMDCDLQDRPEEIIALYKKAQEGFDVVVTNRGKRKDPLIKRLSSHFFHRIFNYFLELNYNIGEGNFRIISRKVVNYCREMREQLRFFTTQIAWMGFTTAEVEVIHAERYAGKSSYNFKKLVKLATEAIIAYSDKPLKLAIKLGFSISTVAFIFGFYVVCRALIYGKTVLGWSSLIASIYFIGGIIIAYLGVLGVYLGKTFDETKKRPLYIVRETTEDIKKWNKSTIMERNCVHDEIL